MLFVAIIVKYLREAQGNGFGSVLHLIGNELEEDEVPCGPQMDIQRVACTVVESNSGYEHRKYLRGEVNFGVGFGVPSLHSSCKFVRMFCCIFLLLIGGCSMHIFSLWGNLATWKNMPKPRNQASA